jgi:hypothetical protein
MALLLFHLLLRGRHISLRGSNAGVATMRCAATVVADAARAPAEHPVDSQAGHLCLLLIALPRAGAAVLLPDFPAAAPHAGVHGCAGAGQLPRLQMLLLLLLPLV